MFVYVIGTESGPVKVGISANPKRRLETLKTSNPAPLELFATCQRDDRRAATTLEEDMHHCMHGRRLRGEWFDATPKQAGFVLSALADPTHVAHSIVKGMASLRRRVAKNKAAIKAAGFEGETVDSLNERYWALRSSFKRPIDA